MRRHGKKLIIVLVLALLASTLSGFGFFQKKQEDYRTVRVYKLDGTATVEREELGSLEAYEGMVLRSGDIVKTPAESWLYFQMDEDKYAMLEPESLLRIEASGTSADSKTYLSLEYGSLAFRVDNKLSADSVYEINTPNSTMAIRGTAGVVKAGRLDFGLKKQDKTSEIKIDVRFQKNIGVSTPEGSLSLETGEEGNSESAYIEMQEIKNSAAIVTSLEGNESQKVKSGANAKTSLKDNGSAEGKNADGSSESPKHDESQEKKNADGSSASENGRKTEPETVTKVATGAARQDESRTAATGDVILKADGKSTPSALGLDGSQKEENADGSSASENGGNSLTVTDIMDATASAKHGESQEGKNPALLKDNSAVYTQLSVTSGIVSSRLKKPDGSISKNEKLVSAGNFATMRIDASSSVYMEDGKVDYTKESLQTLEFLLTAGIGVKSPDQNEELEKAYEELKKQNHTHTGGTATCICPAVCSECGETYGEKDPYFHAETELRNQKTATCRTTGYTGDRYCTGCREMLEMGSATAKSTTNHVGGTEVRNTVTADCMNKGYTGDTYCKGCGGIISKGKATDKSTTNHVGETEVRNAIAADCMTEGYTGDTYCKGCNSLLSKGEATGVDRSNHIGEEVIQDDKVATCHTEGYTGNVYCNACGYRMRSGSIIPFDATNHDGGLYPKEDTKKEATCIAEGHNADIYCYGCGKLYSDGGYIAIDPNNHAGGTYVETVQAPTCCSNGYGNTRCSGCGAVLESGTSIPATGPHTPAACGVTGHCVYDGKTHEIPGCCVDGHCVSDGKDHSQASCGVPGHYNCDGTTHGSNCFATDPTGSPDAAL